MRPVRPVELTHERPWSSVHRVPVDGGAVWFKACNDVQAFEPRLSAELYSRWPDLVGEVIAHDEDRAWLLLADAGARLPDRAPEPWLELLPRYAELQRGEANHASEHVANGVPDLTDSSLPARYAELIERDLPLDAGELARLRAFRPRFEQLCAELASTGPPATVQHDDLHRNNVFELNGSLRVLDWGDSSISHPFFSLVRTFRFVDESAKLKEAYLEPWGPRLRDTFELALRVGSVALAIAWSRQREFLEPTDRRWFDVEFGEILRSALDGIEEAS